MTSRFLLPLAAILASTPLSAVAQTVFLVQFGSFKTEEESSAHWSALKAKFPETLGNLNYFPAEAVLPPDDTVYHRTQAGPVASREQAANICSQLREGAEQCFVVEAVAQTSAGPAPAQAAPVRAFDPEAENQALNGVESNVSPSVQPSVSPAVGGGASTDDELAEAFIAPAVNPVPPQAAEPVEVPAEAPPPQFAPDAPSYQPVAAPVEPLAAAPAPANFAPAPEPMTAAPADTMAPPPAEPETPVSVAEAIPVPLSQPKPAVSANSPYGGGLRGGPGSYSRFMPYWAEIGYFSNPQETRNYWSLLRQRDPAIPDGVRLRVVQPFGRSIGGKLSLRAGPFVSAASVARLCKLTEPEHLGCRTVRETGPSTSTLTGVRRGRNTTPYLDRRRAAKAAPAASPFGAPTPPGGGLGGPMPGSGSYEILLGTFPTPGAAHAHWETLRNGNSRLFSGVGERIVSTNGGRRGVSRLRVGPFLQASAARTVCDLLHGQGEPCIVISAR